MKIWYAPCESGPHNETWIKGEIEDGSKEKEEYTIVGAAEADPAHGKISNESPLGKTLINHKEGDKVQVDAPAGPFVVKVLKVN